MKPLDLKTKIKKRLESGRSITPWQALKDFKCFRLAVYIKRLRNEKMKIETEMVRENGVQYARYSLRKKRK